MGWLGKGGTGLGKMVGLLERGWVGRERGGVRKEWVG